MPSIHKFCIVKIQLLSMIFIKISSLLHSFYRHVYRHRPGMCTIGVQGMFHHYGNCGVMSTCLYSGVKLVVMKNYELEKYIHLIHKYKVYSLAVAVLLNDLNAFEQVIHRQFKVCNHVTCVQREQAPALRYCVQEP